MGIGSTYRTNRGTGLDSDWSGIQSIPKAKETVTPPEEKPVELHDTNSPTLIGRAGQQLPIKTLGQIPTGLTGLAGKTAQEGVDYWKEQKAGMTAAEIKALGPMMDVNVYDTDLLGKQMGLNKDQIAAALQPQNMVTKATNAMGGGHFRGGEAKYRTYDTVPDQLNDKQNFLRGIGSLWGDPRNKLNLEGNWDMTNLMGRGGQPTFGQAINPLKDVSEYESTPGMHASYQRQEQMAAQRAHKLNLAKIGEISAEDFHTGSIRGQKQMLKKSHKSSLHDQIIKGIGLTGAAIVGGIMSGGMGAAAVGAAGLGAGAGATALSTGVGATVGAGFGAGTSAAGGGDPLSGAAMGAVGGGLAGFGAAGGFKAPGAMDILKKGGMGLAKKVPGMVTGGTPTPGEMIKAQGGIQTGFQTMSYMPQIAPGNTEAGRAPQSMSQWQASRRDDRLSTTQQGAL